nr:MAG TPA: hypothetical protein [Caudoviricetes sp.]
MCCHKKRISLFQKFPLMFSQKLCEYLIRPLRIEA